MHSKITGDLNEKSAEEFISRMRITVKKYPNCSGHLVDLTEAILSLSIADLYYYPKFLKTNSMNPSRRRVLLVNQKDRSKYNFFEMASKNQGYGMMIFTNRGDAEDWLNKSD